MHDSPTDVLTARLGAPPVLEIVRQRALDLLLTGAALHGPLAQIVEVDAVLTGLLLRFVRCPLYDGSDARDIAIDEAMLRVGRPVLVHAVTYLPGLPDREERGVVERACNDWVHGLAAAAAARWLANTGEYEDPSGSLHLRARQYDPSSGRFNAVDILSSPIPAMCFRICACFSNPGAFSVDTTTVTAGRSLGETSH